MNQSSFLRIAVAQPASVSHDVAANVRSHTALIRRTDARVVVFPELSLTGYELSTAPLALDSSSLNPLIEACSASDTIALVGAPVKRGDGSMAISTLMVERAGIRLAYEKLFLGTDERKCFCPGDLPRVIEVDGFRLGLAICKDVNVDEHAAATAALDIDGYVASVVKHDHERTALTQRAADLAVTHRMWVAVSSAAGSTGEGFHATAGHSAIWDPEGTCLCAAGPAVDEIVAATLAKQS